MSFPGHLRTNAKVDSSQEIVASSGALQNFTSYLNGTLLNLSTVLQESSDYISENLGVPPSLVYSSLAILVAVPLTMSRYGWISSSREQLSPYTSMSGGAPAVTDEDFSYITSQDLEDSNLGTSDRYNSRSHSANAAPEDDVLLIKHRGVTYPAHFPAYAIGDGKLRVMDVKERVGLMMDLSERATRHIKLLYKGKQLKEPAAPVRDYGVKNNSELIAALPELDDGSSPSEEEMVVVGDTKSKSKSKRGKTKRGSKKKSSKGDGGSLTASSPRDSTSTFEAPNSPEGVISGPMKKLNEIATEFLTKWTPMCEDYIVSTPSDPKKREDDHRRLSETIMQHTLLQLDGVDSEGLAEVRARRKELIQQVQAMLKKLDVAKGS